MEIQLSDVTMHPKGTPAPASSVEARVFEERVDLSNNMTCRQMIGVGVRNMVLARGELAGEVTSELQVVGKAASTAIQTWMRNNDKTKARAEEREKNIGWIKRLFTAWRVSQAERTERRAERKEAGEDDSEEDEPVGIPLSAVTMRPKREGDPSAGIIREGTSVRRESGPEQ